MKQATIEQLQRSCVAVLAFLVLGLNATSVSAATAVFPPEFTSISANDWDDAPLGATNMHFQQVYSVSLLSGLSAGDQITGIGFRLISNEVSVASQTVSDYSIWMGTSA